jgi:hypothetical protein
VQGLRFRVQGHHVQKRKNAQKWEVWASVRGQSDEGQGFASTLPSTGDITRTSRRVFAHQGWAGRWVHTARWRCPPWIDVSGPTELRGSKYRCENIGSKYRCENIGSKYRCENIGSKYVGILKWKYRCEDIGIKLSGQNMSSEDIGQNVGSKCRVKMSGQTSKTDDVLFFFGFGQTNHHRSEMLGQNIVGSTQCATV